MIDPEREAAAATVAQSAGIQYHDCADHRDIGPSVIAKRLGILRCDQEDGANRWRIKRYLMKN